MEKFFGTVYVSEEMLPFLRKVLDDYREKYDTDGLLCDGDQDIIDAIFDDALRRECVKYGYKG